MDDREATILLDGGCEATACTADDSVAAWPKQEPRADNFLPTRSPSRVVACLSLTLALLSVTALEVCLVFDETRRTYGEGPILAMCERMQTETVAADWMRELPYGLSCYGPAFYWATNAVVKATGWRHTFVPGRIVALSAGIGIAVLLGITAYRRTRRLECGLLAAAMFLLSVPAMEWFPYARVDTLAMVFVAGAFLAVGSDRRSLLAAAALIALGSLSKPTAALAALPIAVHLLATRRWREAGYFAAAVSAFGTVAWLIVHGMTGGYFLEAVLIGNANPMSLWRGYSLSYQFLASPLGTIAALVAAWLWITSPRRCLESLYSLGFAISFIVSTAISCKRGAEINYFLETAMLGSLAIAIDGVPRLCQLHVRRSLVALACLAAVMTVPCLRGLKVVSGAVPKGPLWTAPVNHWLAGEPADVELLSDGKVIDSVLANGRQPLVSDPYLYTLLVGNGTLDIAPLMERMQDGRIKWLFFHRTLPYHLGAIERDTHSWPPEVLAALPRYYELVDKRDGLMIYRHRRYNQSVAARR